MEKGSPGVGPLNAILTGWLTLQVMSGGVAAPAAAQSLVVNGDFEAGNVGFTSDFTYSPSSIVGSSEYAIVGNPRDAHSNAASYGDHTLGDGNGLMLAANGRADDVPNVVWRQTASVQAGATYWFSVWHSLWTAGDGAIQLIVNGVPVSAPFQSPGLGEWAELSVAWTAAVTGPAELSIVNTTILWDPNDFALDDISFVPEAATGVRATSWGRLKDMYRRGGRR